MQGQMIHKTKGRKMNVMTGKTSAGIILVRGSKELTSLRAFHKRARPAKGDERDKGIVTPLTRDAGTSKSSGRNVVRIERKTPGKTSPQRPTRIAAVPTRPEAEAEALRASYAAGPGRRSTASERDQAKAELMALVAAARGQSTTSSQDQPSRPTQIGPENSAR